MTTAQDVRIRDFSPVAQGDVLQLCELWNCCAEGAHGYFPLSQASLAQRVLQTPRFRSSKLLSAWIGERLVGALHWDVVQEPYYPQGGSIEVVGVAPDLRGRGIGRRLVQEALARMQGMRLDSTEAGGAWPFCPNYATLIDGSERSGVFLGDHGRPLLNLFEGEGFRRAQGSLVMRADLARLQGEPPRTPPDTRWFIEPRRGRTTWLDWVFRGWRLYDHVLLGARGQVLSRAIFGRMDGLSDHEHRELFALFGVNTPHSERRRGYGRTNLYHLLHRLREAQVDEVELHVHADNEPAVRLYRALGFREIARTVSLRR